MSFELQELFPMTNEALHILISFTVDLSCTTVIKNVFYFFCLYLDSFYLCYDVRRLGLVLGALRQDALMDGLICFAQLGTFTPWRLFISGLSEAFVCQSIPIHLLYLVFPLGWFFHFGSTCWIWFLLFFFLGSSLALLKTFLSSSAIIFCSSSLVLRSTILSAN